MGIAPFFNSAGRMSSMWGRNGSQAMFDLLMQEDNYTFRCLQDLVVQKKAVLNPILDTKEYHDFLVQNVDSTGVVVFTCPPDVDHAFCGLLASRIGEALDLPSIVLTYNAKTKCYSGSCRNRSGRESLKGFLDAALEGKGLDIVYGGHEDALGISHLAKKDYDAFLSAVSEANLAMDPAKAAGSFDSVLLDLSVSDLRTKKAEILQFLSECEPTADVFCVEVPPILDQPAKGTDKNFCTIKTLANKGSVNIWKTVTLLSKDGKTLPRFTDWSYLPEKYKSHPILLEITPDDYDAKKVKANGELTGFSVGLKAAISRAYERELALAQTSPSVDNKKPEAVVPEPKAEEKPKLGWKSVKPVSRRKLEDRER